MPSPCRDRPAATPRRRFTSARSAAKSWHSTTRALKAQLPIGPPWRTCTSAWRMGFSVSPTANRSPRACDLQCGLRLAPLTSVVTEQRSSDPKESVPECPNCHAVAEVRPTWDTFFGCYCRCGVCGFGWHHNRLDDKRRAESKTQ